MKKKILGLATVVALFTASCDANKKAALTLNDLSGEWSISLINGQEVTAEEVPFLGFDIAGSKLYGSTGCNNIMGTLVADTLQPGQLQFDQVASTRRMCQDMATEELLLQALSQVAGFARGEFGINLVNAEGTAVLTMEKRELSALTLVEGKWMIKEVGSLDLSGLDEAPYIEINVNDLKMNGNAGCNLINGVIEQEPGLGHSLQFTQVISTMKACPAMDIERGLLLALDSVRSFAVENGALVLFDENKTQVMELARP